MAARPVTTLASVRVCEYGEFRAGRAVWSQATPFFRGWWRSSPACQSCICEPTGGDVLLQEPCRSRRLDVLQRAFRQSVSACGRLRGQDTESAKPADLS